MEPTVSEVEKQLYSFVASHDQATHINLKQTSAFVYNSRHQKLHFRMYFKRNTPIKALLVFIHGYSSHCNKPTHLYIAEKCLESDLALVCLDLHGHGYSEGMRAYVDDGNKLVDDVQCLLRYLYSESLDLNDSDLNCSLQHHNELHPRYHAHHEHHKEHCDYQESFLTKKTKGKYPRLCLIEKQVPFFLMGESMGGAVVLNTSLYFQNILKQRQEGGGGGDVQRDNSEYPLEYSCWTTCNHAHLYRGTMLLAPMIYATLPHPVVIWVFMNVFLPLWGEASMPSAFENFDPTRGFVDEHYAHYIKHKDRQDRGGLSFHDPMRFRTAHTLLGIMAQLTKDIQHVEFPFIVFHDPHDQITLYHGTELLFNTCATPVSDKKLIQLPDARHDVGSSRLAYIIDETLKWVEGRLAKGYR